MPCIIDLGIARFLDLESLTRTISPMGPCTPIYAAPEQLTNNKALIDPRTDFFGLGIIALELYLGVYPLTQTMSEISILLLKTSCKTNMLYKLTLSIKIQQLKNLQLEHCKHNHTIDLEIIRC